MSCVWVPTSSELSNGSHRSVNVGLPLTYPAFGMFTDFFIAGLPSGSEESHFIEPAIKEFLTLPRAC